MLATVKGYYDGNQIVVDEAERHHLNIGDELIITVLDNIATKRELRADRRKKIIESEDFVNPTGRTVEEVNSYIRELRVDDRL